MSAPPVIITRAQPGAEETAKNVLALGLTPIISPAIELRLVDPVPSISLEGAAGVLFTSANGVRFFCEISDHRELPAWCVGPSTFSAAKSAGFTIAHNADGNAQDLANLVADKSDPALGHLVHVANTAAGTALQSKLGAAGFDVRFVGLYDPVGVDALADGAANAIAHGPVCVLIHSEKGAQRFAALVEQMETHDLLFVCVSEKAARPVSNLGEIRLAARPNEQELLRVLKDWGQTL